MFKEVFEAKTEQPKTHWVVKDGAMLVWTGARTGKYTKNTRMATRFTIMDAQKLPRIEQGKAVRISDTVTESVTYKGAKGVNANHIKEIIADYDFYTNYIDSNVQKAKKDKSNEKVKVYLKTLGVTEISSGDVTVKL